VMLLNKESPGSLLTLGFTAPIDYMKNTKLKPILCWLPSLSPLHVRQIALLNFPWITPGCD